MMLSGLTLRGLGQDCPSFAPYRMPASRGGGCSNVPPEAEASGPPAGVTQNPVTGVYETIYVDPNRDLNEAMYAPGAGEANRAAAQAEQDEAIRQARERGIPISCELRTNSAPGVPAIFWSECTVAGVPGHDAGLLIRPGGWNIATTEALRVTGEYISPGSVTPAYIPPGQQAAASAASGKPNQSVPPQDTSVPLKTGITNTGAAMANGQQQATAALPAVETNWLLLAAGAAALWFFTRR